jgi:succinate dehydrogenase / fumarate reductase cytochrome b subunit
MGNNPLVQFVLQPILIFGVVFHFTMGFVLEIQNRKSRAVQYVKYKGSANASWVSRNMIWSGAVVLSFLGLHFYDFWFPEMNYKYIEVLPLDPARYYEEMTHKFHDFLRVGLYIISFIFLALHLNHGFASSFQSVGVNNKYSSSIKKFAIAFSVIIPVGFIFIALFHHINSL